MSEVSPWAKTNAHLVWGNWPSSENIQLAQYSQIIELEITQNMAILPVADIQIEDSIEN